MNPEHDPDFWQQMDIGTDNSGHVTGQAVSEPLPGGYLVVASVTSYDYDRGDQTLTNHVPNVVITHETGAIVAEPEARDSHVALSAVNAALQAGEYAGENLDRFLD